MTTDALLVWLAEPQLFFGRVGLNGLGLSLALLALLFLVLWRRAAGEARRLFFETQTHGGLADDRLEAISRAQGEIAGRVQSMAEVLGSRQADLARALSERFEGLGSRVGQSILASSAETKASLSALTERLAVIDRAQGEIRGLAGEMVRLQDILANKQTRGAFGEGRMQAIVTDALPRGSYSFQATLSNGRRPDCLIHMPNGAPSLAVDAKFPLEAFSALKAAEGEDAMQAAAQRLRRDMDVHLQAIAGRYLIPGETQEVAFLFLPSESIFADLHERFEDVVQKAHRLRVVIVSPSLLLLSIQVVQALLRDQRMRAEAGRIQEEVRHLTADLQRLDERVAALRTHFGQTTRDVDQILISTGKLIKRGERIDAMELGPDDAQAPAAQPRVAPG